MQRMTYWYKDSKASNTHLSFNFNQQHLAYYQPCHPHRIHKNDFTHTLSSSTLIVQSSNKSSYNKLNKKNSKPHLKLNIKTSINLFSDSLTSKISVYHDSTVTDKKISKIKILASLSGLALVSLPAIGITTSLFNSAKKEAYSTVMATQTLTLASVAGESTFFATDDFQHGFGYDITRSYANQLGVNLVVKTYANETDALQAITKGDADMALTTASTKLIEKNAIAAINISCGYDGSLIENGLNPKTSWSFRSHKDPLAVKANQFLCNNDQLVNTANIANFYDQTLLKNNYNQKHFEKVLTNTLPLYQSSFQEQAKNYDHDWELLVAMGYQESQLNANAISPTGVRGLMMLTDDTAKAMGVSNRIDPYQSIGGGARYLEQLMQRFSDIPQQDRVWFALASYNMGPNAIKRIQVKLSQANKDPNSWANVYAYLLNNASSNPRYLQCMHYVTNIRSYLETLKTRSA